MLEIIDIEDILTWAYRAQAVDRMAAGIWEAIGQRGPASFGQNPLSAICGLGVRVDGGGWRGAAGHGYGGTASAVSDDALTLHEAVLALPSMLMEISESGGITLTWSDRMASAGLSERPDGQLCRGGQAVTGETVEPAILVIAHARAASRPETLDDFVADFSERPRDSAGRWIADRDTYRQTLDDVIRMRGLYAAWRAGLARLVEGCGGLMRHQLTGPAAPEAPWATRAVPVVHQSLAPPVSMPAKRARARPAKRRKPVMDRLSSTC
jgi:hypothetical protein